MDIDVPAAVEAEVSLLAAASQQHCPPPPHLALMHNDALITDTPARCEQIPTDTGMHCQSTATAPTNVPSHATSTMLTATASQQPPPSSPHTAPTDIQTAPSATEPTDGKRRRVVSPSPPPSPPAPQPTMPLDQIAAHLTALLSTVSTTLSDIQSGTDDTLPLTQRQARSVLDALTAGLATLLEAVRTLSHAPLSVPSPVPAHNDTAPSAPQSQAAATAPSASAFPPLSHHLPSSNAQGRPQHSSPLTPRAPASQHGAPASRVLSYADRLRSQHHSADGESRRRLAGRILVAPPPMQRRLIPLARAPQSRIASDLERMQVIYVRGLLRMPFREMRGYLHDLSPRLSNKSILSISYFGPLTSFICIDEPTAATLCEHLTAAGGRVDREFRPWLPLRRDQQDDTEAQQRAVETFCRRIAGEIVSSPNLLLATFLQRHLAPHLAPAISALVRGSPSGLRVSPQTTPPAPVATTPCPGPPTAPSLARPPVARPTPAAPAASTSAPASSGDVAEGTV